MGGDNVEGEQIEGGGDVEVSEHVNIQQSRSHHTMPKDRGIESILPEITDGAQEGLVLLDVGQRKLDAVGYPQIGPNLVFGSRHLAVPLSPPGN